MPLHIYIYTQIIYLYIPINHIVSHCSPLHKKSEYTYAITWSYVRVSEVNMARVSSCCRQIYIIYLITVLNDILIFVLTISLYSVILIAWFKDFGVFFSIGRMKGSSSRTNDSCSPRYRGFLYTSAKIPGASSSIETITQVALSITSTGPTSTARPVLFFVSLGHEVGLVRK